MNSRYLSGLSAWLVQRLSAIYMALFVILAPWGWVAISGFEDWRALFADRPGGIAVGLFIIALLLHSWVGMRDIILDYFGQHAALRLLLLGLLGGWLMLLGLWTLHILIGVWA